MKQEKAPTSYPFPKYLASLADGFPGGILCLGRVLGNVILDYKIIDFRGRKSKTGTSSQDLRGTEPARVRTCLAPSPGTQRHEGTGADMVLGEGIRFFSSQ